MEEFQAEIGKASLVSLPRLSHERSASFSERIDPFTVPATGSRSWPQRSDEDPSVGRILHEDRPGPLRLGMLAGARSEAEMERRHGKMTHEGGHRGRMRTDVEGQVVGMVRSRPFHTNPCVDHLVIGDSADATSGLECTER